MNLYLRGLSSTRPAVETDRELILQCLNKDLTAQKKLYTQFAPKMLAICQRFARNGTEADDILQNGFLRVFSHLHQFRFEGPLEGWVRRIIVNSAINFTRQHININREINVELLSPDTTMCEDALSRLSAKDLLSIIQNLPPCYRAVFNLHEIEGYDHKEIGVILGIPEGTSKSQLYRAKASIRRRLKGPGMG